MVSLPSEVCVAGHSLPLLLGPRSPPLGSVHIGADVSGAGGSLSAKASTTVATTRGKYTWQEVAKHNTAESAWVIVEGKVYDVTHFLDKHPGGKEMLLLSAGRECTALFTSYHWATEKPRKYLSAYEIGEGRR